VLVSGRSAAKPPTSPAQQTFASGLVTAPAVRQCCDVGGRPPKAGMRSPIPEACIPDLTLLCHLLAAEGLLFPSPSFCSDIAVAGLQQEPCAFKGLRTSAGFYLLGFRFGQDSSPPPGIHFPSFLITFTYSVLNEINSNVIIIINLN